MNSHDHKCGNGCGADIDKSNSSGHHSETRHADGGTTTTDNHSEVCKDCHKELHDGK
ncbi:HNH endonuclease [Massilia sp. TSP1-1-2]|uniref:HNH endonuclease n=1 Tax=Massilia sp. TSP1-1-2 TaxID=2804649 RepID=UPI003CF3C781